jgi:anaerobic selenocysteine-containing dehydrogenase
MSPVTTCPLCEATCGLEITFEGDVVARVTGDPRDVFSHGFICPKGGSLGALHHDPDRLRTPLVRRDGELVEATWHEAFEEIDRRLQPILAADRNAVGVYVGNPAAHNLATMLYGRVFNKALGSRNVYSASTVDQMPKHVSAGYMFGGALTIPVPDLDRTMHLLVLGANPLASNGSLMTAPDARGRLRGIRERGGKVVVVDPRRSRTAEHADEHHFIRPGTDALLLFALVHVLFEEGQVHTSHMFNGADEVRALADPFTPDAVAGPTGIAADEIRRMARELAAADRAAVYGRIGTTLQQFGTLASWLVDVLNALTGNLDREGGAMFPLAAAGQTNADPNAPARGFKTGRWTSRVRGLPEAIGELPVSTLADEIVTPGEGQIRALFTISGNPALSTPNAGRLDAALEQLELLVCLDVYVNETTRHADVVLPGPTALERPHYDLALYQLAVRNVANYSPPLLETDMPQEWQTLLRLTGIVTGQGPDADITAIDAFVAQQLAGPNGPPDGAVPISGGQDARPGTLMPEGRTGPERLLDILLRKGPYDLTLDALEAAPHGIDLGPLQPRLPEALRTPSGKVELAPPEITRDVPRLEAELGREVNGQMVLIGRRQLRSNNSWMHNLTPLVRGKERCTAWLHPDDAERFGLFTGDVATISSRAGSVEVPVEVTDAIMPGVVSIPHGWGHDVDGSRLSVARAHAGVNSNLLGDEQVIEPLSGNAVLNGIPVQVVASREPTVAAAATQ